MLGIEDYGSGVESGDETSNTTSKAMPTPSTSSLFSKLPPPTSKSTPRSSLSLPEPRSSSITTATPKPKRTKKIAINLPSLPPPEDDDDDDGPPAKKPRIASSTGAGNSPLLSMLPAPKQPAPVIEKRVERVLRGGGGPGLVFRTSTSQTRRDPGAAGVAGAEEPLDASDAGAAEVQGPADVSAPSTSFLPPSLRQARRIYPLRTKNHPNALLR